MAGFLEEAKGGTGRPELLGLLSVSQSASSRANPKAAILNLPPHPAQQLDPAYL